MAKTAVVKLNIDSRVHDKMRELARRRREFIGLTYERAAVLFLKQPDNYMGLDNVVPETDKTKRKDESNG